MAAHAKVGPSALSRVKLCPGSVAASEGAPNNNTEAAAEGTVLHDIAADCAEFGFEPEDYLGKTMRDGEFEFKIGTEPSQTDPTVMNDALDWIRSQPGILFVENRVPLDPWLPGQFGTKDIGIYDPETNTATVFDWKFGAGILVHLEHNYQLRAYGLGFLQLLRAAGYPDPVKFRFIIEQPRCSGAPRYSDVWEQTYDEMMEFAAELEQIWAAANDPDAPRVAGLKQCYFCNAKNKPGGCPEHNEFMFDVACQKMEDADGEDEPDLPHPSLLTAERRSWIVKHKSMFTSWLEHLSAQTMEIAMQDGFTPGLKAVDGDKGHRFYKDEERATAILIAAVGADQAFTKKLKSPTQAEKVLKPTRKKAGHPEAWAELEALIDQPPGKPILVSEDDPRPKLLTAEDKMDEVED